jgi:hypothetical protein
MMNERRTHEQITHVYKHNFIQNSWITEIDQSYNKINIQDDSYLDSKVDLEPEVELL